MVPEDSPSQSTPRSRDRTLAIRFTRREGAMEHSQYLLTAAYQLATIGMFLLELRKLRRKS